jgi:hypothetical protein
MCRAWEIQRVCGGTSLGSSAHPTATLESSKASAAVRWGWRSRAGRKFEQYKQAGETYESIRKGAWDPVERLKDMDLDGVDAEVIYPNLGIGHVGPGF